MLALTEWGSLFIYGQVLSVIVVMIHEYFLGWYCQLYFSIYWIS